MGSTRRRVAAVVAVLALGLPACSGDEAAPASDGSQEPSARETSTSAASPTPAPSTATPTAQEAGDEVAVELLDPGAEPRRELRLSPEAGDRGAIDMRMTMGATMTLDGQQAPALDLPPMLMGVEVVVDDVTPDTLTMSYTYDRVGLDGPDPGGLEQALSAIQDLSGTATTTRRGAYVDGSIDVPAGADPALAQMLAQFDQQMASLTVPLPVEAVGVGARWRVATDMEVNGVGVEQAATYELRSLEGDRFAFDVEMDQRFVPGTIPQAGATVEVLDGSGTGRGSVQGSLTFPMAMAGEMQMATAMTARITAGDQQQTMRTDQQMRVEMSPR